LTLAILLESYLDKGIDKLTMIDLCSRK